MGTSARHTILDNGNGNEVANMWVYQATQIYKGFILWHLNTVTHVPYILVSGKHPGAYWGVGGKPEDSKSALNTERVKWPDTTRYSG